jgi:hypothetical protein
LIDIGIAATTITHAATMEVFICSVRMVATLSARSHEDCSELHSEAPQQRGPAWPTDAFCAAALTGEGYRGEPPTMIDSVILTDV